MSILKVQNVSFSYTPEVKAIDDVSFSVGEGDFLAVLGPNGSGKSTLVAVISGVQRPGSGKTILDGKDITNMNRREIARKISFVPQTIQVDFPFTCRQIVMMGRFSHLKGLGVEGKEDHEAAEKALKLTGVAHLADRMIHQVSGGERQRVFIAQAIAAQPRIIILDEPVSALDIRYKVKVLNLLKQLNEKEGITVITILHDLNMASLYTNRVLILKNGAVMAAGPPEEVISPEIVKRAYDIDVNVIERGKGLPGLITPIIESG